MAWCIIDEPKFRPSVGAVPLDQSPGLLPVSRAECGRVVAWQSRDSIQLPLLRAGAIDDSPRRSRRSRAHADDTYVFYNNHYRAKAVVNATQLKAALGQPVQADSHRRDADRLPGAHVPGRAAVGPLATRRRGRRRLGRRRGQPPGPRRLVAIAYLRSVTHHKKSRGGPTGRRGFSCHAPRANGWGRYDSLAVRGIRYPVRSPGCHSLGRTRRTRTRIPGARTASRSRHRMGSRCYQTHTRRRRAPRSHPSQSWNHSPRRSRRPRRSQMPGSQAGTSVTAIPRPGHRSRRPRRSQRPYSDARAVASARIATPRRSQRPDSPCWGLRSQRPDSRRPCRSQRPDSRSRRPDSRCQRHSQRPGSLSRTPG